MDFRKLFIFIFTFTFLFVFQMQAQNNTTVVVRAQAKDAKFIGDGMGGAMITILDTSTGDTLAHGLTKGGTGDTERLVKDPVERYEQLSTPGSAKFEATLALQEPKLVTIQATAPYGKPHATVTTSTQKWLIPGKDITGDGIILEIPGFVITNRLPEKTTFTTGEEIPIRSHIEMMCGCPTSDGGLWDSFEYEIKAQLRKGNALVTEVPLNFTGDTSLFEGTITASEAGDYAILVYAFHPETANSGVAKTEITVTEK